MKFKKYWVTEKWNTEKILKMVFISGEVEI
jgi:hypothetical protein